MMQGNNGGMRECEGLGSPADNNGVLSLDPGVYFTKGLSDVSPVIGKAAELVCKLSADCDGVWYKEAVDTLEMEEVRNGCW